MKSLATDSKVRAGQRVPSSKTSLGPAQLRPRPTASAVGRSRPGAPLFIAPDDQPLTTRVRLDHYTQLVRAELHLAINAGSSAEDCAQHARFRVPRWGDATIADILTDRGANTQLRSYPAGIDW
jgi:hypothetical protein